MKKNIYMWQPNYTFGKEAYLPYSIGALAAYAWQDDFISSEYDLCNLFFTRESIDKTINSLQDPFLCAFSCYSWNYEYNKETARRIKERFPECRIVFGGHQISPETVKSDFSNSDYICIYDEGEVAFKEVLKTLAEEGDLGSVCNISYLNGSQLIFTKREMVTITDFPSPYLSGTFDKIMQNSDYSFSATLETNRGCPYSCAYCDWGVYKSKIRQFPMERIKAEINWFASHKINLVFGADSNFGIFERDEEIIDYLIYQNKKCGFPQKFRVAYAKNTDDRIFEINRKLNEYGMCKGATLSFQSLNPETLESIGRKNVNQEYFARFLKKYHKENIPTYSEIIMGLPDETFQTFQKGLGELIKSGQHSSMNIYLCELLPNSRMAQPDYMEKYKIKTLTVPLNQYHCAPPEEDDIKEYSHIVVENSVLTKEEWKDCYIYSWAIQTFHCLGLLRYFAMYSYYEKNIEYSDFYSELMRFFGENPDTIGGKSMNATRNIIDTAFNDSNNSSFVYLNKRFGNILWPTEEGSYLEILTQLDEFYSQLYVFFRQIGIDEKMISQLELFQKNIIRKPFDKNHCVSFEYNFADYFSANQSGKFVKLERCSSEFQVNVKKEYDNWPDFAREIVWYGRKGGSTHYEY